MRASLRDLILEPDPRLLPGSPEMFFLSARMIIGPTDGQGEESFEATVCSPEWLAVRCRDGGIVDGRHHLIVSAEKFSRQHLAEWVAKRISTVSGDTWSELAEKLSRLGYWEFEDYTA